MNSIQNYFQQKKEEQLFLVKERKPRICPDWLRAHHATCTFPRKDKKTRLVSLQTEFRRKVDFIQIPIQITGCCLAVARRWNYLKFPKQATLCLGAENWKWWKFTVQHIVERKRGSDFRQSKNKPKEPDMLR